MIPIRLKLVNFLGVKYGLNTSELEINFSKFEPGVIGIVGETGSGKTVIAENMNPFLMMMTRPGHLFNHTYGDAVKEFEFVMNGEKYLSKVLIDTDKKKIKPYLYRWIDDDWMVITDKKKEYNAAVTEILGDFSSFKRSVFTPQGDIPLITLKDTELKNMFINLFGLNKYPEIYLPFVKSKLAELDEKIQENNIFISMYDDKQQKLEQLESELEVLRKELAEAQKDYDVVKNYENNIEAKTIAKENEIKKAMEDREKLRYLEDNISKTEIELKEAVKDSLEAVKKIEKEIASNEKDLNQHKTGLLVLEQTSERWIKIIQNKDLIKEKHERIVFLQKEIDGIKSELVAIQKDKDDLKSKERELQLLTNNLNLINKNLLENQERSQLLHEVPCHGSDLANNCKLLESAINASKTIFDLEAQKAELDSKKSTITDQISGLRDKINEFSNIESSLPGLESELTDLLSKKWDRLYSDIPEAEKEYNDYLYKKEWYNKQIKICEKVDSEIHEKLAQKEADVEAVAIPYRDKIQAWRDELEEKIKLINPIALQEELDELRYELQKARSSTLIAGQKLTELKTSSDIHNKQVVELKDSLSQLNEKKKMIDVMVSDYGDWRLLERAFKEIPVLELESASISLTDNTNNLLSEVFDYELSIKVVTIMPKLSGGDKDVFKIMVYKDGEEVLPSNLSGGQKQIIDSALRMGIELTIKEVSNFEYKMSVFDEADSAIDTRRSISFFEMVNTVHKNNDKIYTFIITHKTEVKNRLDQVIDVEDLKEM